MKKRPEAEAVGHPSAPAQGNLPKEPDNRAIICPVCGASAVQEKCKIICRSETCRGRVVMNCSEF